MDQLAPTEPFRPSMGPIVKVQNAPIIPGKAAELYAFCVCHFGLNTSVYYVNVSFFHCSTQSSELKRTLPIAKEAFEIPPALLRFLNSGFKEHDNMSPGEKKNLEHIRSVGKNLELYMFSSLFLLYAVLYFVKLNFILFFCRAMLPQGDSRDALTAFNYPQLLELLLFIEEHQMSRDIHYYDMHSAVLKQNSLGLWLEVCQHCLLFCHS